MKGLLWNRLHRPAGWRYLKRGEIIKRGDRVSLDYDYWETPECLVGTPAQFTRAFPTIRRVTGKQRGLMPIIYTIVPNENTK